MEWSPQDDFDIEKDSWEWQVTDYEARFFKSVRGCKKSLRRDIDTDIDPIAFGVLVEMVSQMGYEERQSKFVKLHEALKNQDYQKAAAEEMLDSQ